MGVLDRVRSDIGLLPNLIVPVGIAGGLGLAGKAARNFDPNTSIAGKLSFPEDLYKFSISMCFSFKQYKRRSMFNQPYEKASDIIRLPVAKNITDSYKMDWQKSSDDPFVGATLEGLLATEQQFQWNLDPSNLINGLLNAGGTATGAAIGLGVKAATAELADKKVNPTSLTFDKALQPFGVVTNPFLTVMFKQPEFKKHVFSWKFIPRNPKEAQDLNAIIQTFKYHMLPDIVPNAGGTMLTYPDIVNISFYNIDNYLYRFKTCVLENMEINYAPGSQGPSFFKGSQNVPTEIDLKLNFLEIEYWTKNDMAGAPTSKGGGNKTFGYIPNTNP